MFWPEPGSFQQCTHWVHARQQPRPQLQTNLGRGEGGGQMGPLFTLAFSKSSSRMASLTCNSDYRFLLWNGVHHKSLSTPECHMFLQVVPSESESEKENYSIWETNSPATLHTVDFSSLWTLRGVHSKHLIDFHKWVRQGLWLISPVVDSIIPTYVVLNSDRRTRLVFKGSWNQQ